MELEGSLPCSQEPYTGLSSEPDQSSPYRPNLSLVRSILMLNIRLRFGVYSDLFIFSFAPVLYTHSCCMHCTSLPPWLYLSNYTWWTAQVMKLLIMQLSPTSYHFIFRQFRYSPQNPVGTLALCSSFNFQNHYFSENLVAPGIETGPRDL
jgi:hypothetical protein